MVRKSFLFIISWDEGEQSGQHLWDCGRPTRWTIQELLAGHERIKDRACHRTVEQKKMVCIIIYNTYNTLHKRQR